MWAVGVLAFGEQFIAIAYNCVLRLLRPKREVYRHSHYVDESQYRVMNWRSRPSYSTTKDQDFKSCKRLHPY
jgi:hypothetical protein